MPITAWDCPVCLHCPVPLDHYETSNCGLAIHPDYAAAVLHSNDDYYGKELLTVTAGLGCPRSRALEYDTDVVVNPLDYNALLAGKAWDLAVQRYAPPDAVKLELKGQIEGMTIYGEVDRVRRLQGRLMIEDHKNSNNNQQRFLKDEIKKGIAVKMEYRIQTSIYAELYEQMFGERPTHGMIWNHYAGAESSYNSVFIPLLYEVLPLEACLDHKPYGGEYTVRELYQQAESYHMQDELAADSLPLAGASMNFGKQTMCDYCQVRKACMIAAQGAPF